MTSKPSLSGEALRLSLLAQAADHSAKENPDSAMQAVAERARRLAAKAIREGKGGLVTDGKGTFAIVEK